MISSLLRETGRRPDACAWVTSGRLACRILLFSFAFTAGCRTGPAALTYPTPLAAVQAAVSQRLNQPVALQTDIVNEHDGWAFVVGLPLTMTGERVDYSGTVHAGEVAGGYFDDNFMALVRRSEGPEAGWQSIELSIGATDAPFVDWFERHGLPMTLADPAPTPGEGVRGHRQPFGGP